MKLVKCEKAILNNLRGYNACKMQKIVQEFVESDMDCAEIKEFHQKTAVICANTFNKSCEKMHIKGVKAFTRNNRCFLVKESDSKGEA